MVSLLDAPSDMYGKIMSWPDTLIIPAFELCTDCTLEDLKEIKKQLDGGANPRDLKMRLAYEVVRLCAGEKEAEHAQDSFISTFQKKDEATDALQIPIQNRTLEAILVEEEIVSSKGELRRLVEAGAVSDFETKTQLSMEAVKAGAKPGTYKIGKSRFVTLR